MDIVTYALLNGKIKNYASNVDEWLEENVDPATGYVLDRSLQMENAAAPADMVGDINVEVGDLRNTLSEITEPSINLFDPFDVETGFYLDSSGDQASDANSQTTGYIPVTAGETYINTSLDGSYYMCTYNSSKVFIERINAYYASTRTFGNNVAYIRISYYQHSFPANFMLVEGTALPTEYISHVAIKKVVLPEDVKATTELLVESPNLFDISAKTHGKYQTAAGGLKNETDSEISDYILVEYGKKYCFSSLPPSWYWYIGTFTADRTFIERLNAYQSDNPFQFGSTVAYIRISIYQHSFPSDYMALNSDTLPQAFYPYGYIANNDLIIADNGKVKVTKLDSANYIVRTGKGTHTLTHDIENIKNLNTWRLTQATVTGKELWHDVDVEGPIKQKDVSDYMTGYHGDEQFTVLSVLVDGVETDLDEVEVGSIIECSNFTVCVTSDVYFDGSTINKAFVRCKRLVFDGNTLKIFNTYKYIANDPIQIDISTGTGLYPVKSTVVTSYTTNTGNTIVSEETTNRNDMLDSVSFFGDGFVINLHVLFGKTNGYFGVVYYLPEQTRYKVYFYQHYTTGTNYLTLNNGDELCSGYEIEFI